MVITAATSAVTPATGAIPRKWPGGSPSGRAGVIRPDAVGWARRTSERSRPTGFRRAQAEPPGRDGSAPHSTGATAQFAGSWRAVDHAGTIEPMEARTRRI